MYPNFLNFVLESSNHINNLNFNENFFFFKNPSLFLTAWSDSFCHVNLSKASSEHSHILINYINQIEDLNLYNNVENITSIYHYSIPNTKLSYPEPFIASPSFMHSDLWFVHILIYQYWLWFVFIFIIIFFFITFLCTVRWCNMRVRPRRETRGVSRSKCGDLITACVPVSWATSIIVNESTDAIDYYDGFGTTELVVGIRAYQWGWEYYYPKDIDLNYNIKQNYSSFIGNSLKYNKTTSLNVKANNLWKFYQNKTSDSVITPAHLLVLPLDNYKLFNFLNFNDIGANTSQEMNAFKKIKMFSKTFTSNLTFLPNNFSFKYKQFYSFYVNSNNFYDSYLYGTKRQHNLLSTESLSNNQNTFLNLNSVNKIINYNFKNNFSTNINSNKNNFNFFEKSKSSNSNFFYLSLNNILFKNFNLKEINNLNNLINFSNSINLINNNSEKNINFNPLNKLFNMKLLKFNFDKSNFNKLNNNTDFTFVKNNNELDNFFFNNQISYKNYSSFSNNQNLTLSDKFLRNFIKISPRSSHHNFNSLLNSLNYNLNNYNLSIGSNSFNYFNLASNNWNDLTFLSKTTNFKNIIDYPYSPIASNHSTISTIEYDNLKTSPIEDLPLILQGKEENMPLFLVNIYWASLWANSTINWRLINDFNYNNIHRFFYLPTFSFYYDYDFRNWQSLQLFEDLFWESTLSIYTNEEYSSLVKDYYNHEIVDKFNNLFIKFNKNYIFEDKILNKPFFDDVSSTGEIYANSFFIEDNINSLSSINTKDYATLSSFSLLNNLEESYDSFKSIYNFFNSNHKLLSFFSSSSFNLQNFSFVFDIFRSDSETFFWFVDENNYKNINNLNIFFFKNPLFLAKILNNFNENLQLNFIEFDDDKLNRFSNHLNLRAPIKSSIVSYNALQKVFRTRYDENRSHANLNDLSGSYVKQPLISSSRIQYEKILGKTKENFFKNNFFKTNNLKFLNNFYNTDTNLNFYFFDFPFLLAMKSDASKYLWFDWFAKWGFYEVQPSSSSRYAIYGMPYLSKNFEFSNNSSESLNETETYFLRLSRARKNYITNWTYAPYLYARNSFWFKNNLYFNILEFTNKNIENVFFSLSLMNWYWLNLNFIDFSNYQFFPSNSGINSFVKLSWKPQNSIQSYYYNLSNLIDILTKREFLYREFLFSSNKIINLPQYLTNAPSNPLVNELKSSFLFVDPINHANEYSRSIYFYSLNFFNFIVLKSFLNSFDYLNISFLTKNLFFYFFENNLNISKYNEELYKNQYRPMRKGISNMIRLHATGAVAMPIEIRLQILASSKDVIHSWAIPSAGIKIDCVPGYSSHKVMIFLVSGIFWGQCMEICGRYHHWMPIVIYFMKRDLFFLWCTHFVFLNGNNNMWSINDRQFTDYVKPVSFDKYSWLSELNQ